MAKEFLTLKEASEITGKSIITIRRLISKLKNPGIKKVKTNTGFMYLISKDFLNTHFNYSSNQKAQIQDEKLSTQDNKVINQLISLTEFLKKQLEEKDKQISEINNRLKESNVINMGLQTRLQITDKKPNIFARLFLKNKREDQGENL